MTEHDETQHAPAQPQEEQAEHPQVGESAEDKQEASATPGGHGWNPPVFEEGSFNPWDDHSGGDTPAEQMPPVAPGDPSGVGSGTPGSSGGVEAGALGGTGTRAPGQDPEEAKAAEQRASDEQLAAAGQRAAATEQQSAEAGKANKATAQPARQPRTRNT